VTIRYDTVQYIYVRSNVDEMARTTARHRNEKNKEELNKNKTE